jgi:hypothetical protein
MKKSKAQLEYEKNLIELPKNYMVFQQINLNKKYQKFKKVV